MGTSEFLSSWVVIDVGVGASLVASRDNFQKDRCQRPLLAIPGCESRTWSEVELWRSVVSLSLLNGWTYDEECAILFSSTFTFRFQGQREWRK